MTGHAPRIANRSLLPRRVLNSSLASLCPDTLRNVRGSAFETPFRRDVFVLRHTADEVPVRADQLARCVDTLSQTGRNPVLPGKAPSRHRTRQSEAPLTSGPAVWEEGRGRPFRVGSRDSTVRSFYTANAWQANQRIRRADSKTRGRLVRSSAFRRQFSVFAHQN